MKHLCLCPNNSCRSSRAPHPAHLPNGILPTPRSFAVAPGAMLAFSEQAKSPITRPWPSWATHLEVSDLKMEESWLNHAFERRLGEAIAKPPKARTDVPQSGTGFQRATPFGVFLPSLLVTRQEATPMPHSAARSCTRVKRRSCLKFNFLLHQQIKI